MQNPIASTKQGGLTGEDSKSTPLHEPLGSDGRRVVAGHGDRTDHSQDILPPQTRILIIDDMPAIHEDFRKILSKSGLPALEEAETVLFGLAPKRMRRADFALDSAFQGEEGLRRVEAAVAEGRPYALAFVDVRMPPGWDGIETTAKLWTADPDLQVVICTAYSDYSWEDMVQRLGQNDRLVFLKKPFDNVEVLQLGHALAKKWMLTQQVRWRMEDLDRAVNQRTQELRASNEALARAQQRLSHLLAQSPAVVYSLKVEGETISPVWVSENVGQLLGFEPEEVSHPEWWSECAHPTDREQVANSRAELFRENRAALEFRIRHRDGHYRWVHSEQRLLRDDQGRSVEIIGTWMDITGRKELEEQLRQSQKMEAIGLLAGGVAHDFNNLLAVIRGNTELVLMAEGQFPGDPRDCLKQVVSAADRAANLTRQLLAFGRKQVMQLQPRNLNDVVGNLTKMLKRIIGEDIQLQCTYGARLPLAQADVGMIEQVLINLAVNARDAMPRGGQLLITTETVRIDSVYTQAHPEARPGEFVRLAVSDTGTGIAPEHMPRIFEPFFTTKEVGKGTGLGLATVYGIVKQHQGWIEVASKVGAGTLFQIYLPALPQAQTTPAASPAETKPRGGTERVLLVEDDDSVRALTRLLLESFGYQVVAAASGPEALKAWHGHEGQVDLLLTDVIMPEGITGPELAAQLHVERPGLKVVFMSGYSGEWASEEVRLKRYGHAQFLQKPCTAYQILNTVRDSLDQPAPGI